MPWAAWQDSILAFLDAGRFDDAILTIERALNEGQNAADLLALLRRVEDSAVGALGLQGLQLKVRLTGNAQTPEDVIALVRSAQAAGIRSGALHAHLAWALTQQEAFAEALQAAKAALRERSRLTRRELGLALRMKGFALNRLDAHADWEAAFREALDVSVGWTRGMVLLDLGGLRSRGGDEAGAMLAYAEALTLVVSVEHRALLLNNMGLICLRLGRFEEAEAYFMQVAGLRPLFRSRALSGQAAARRALGEWARAESLYRQAAGAAQVGMDEDDLRQALRGLGHTQRLAGRHMQALTTLREAAHVTQGDLDSGTSWVNVDLAATLASLDHLDAALVEAHLARTGPLDREDGERAAIVRAEIARRSGHPHRALALLAPVGRTSLWMREEAHAFPLLFALLPPDQHPEPLPRPHQTQVHLRVLGVPTLHVNGRRVQLKNLEMVVLTALVMAGEDLSTDELIHVVRDARPRDTRQAAQRVSRIVRQLRVALGWEGSVIAGSGTYRLDPAASWTSDVQEALDQHAPVSAFLSGVSLPWATEQEQYLLQRDLDDLTDSLG